MTVCGKTVCGSTGWKVFPPSVDQAALQFAVANITPSAVVAPLGSAQVSRGSPERLEQPRPAPSSGAIAALPATTIGERVPRALGGASVRRGADTVTSGIGFATVGVAVGVPAMNGAFGTIQPGPSTS